MSSTKNVLKPVKIASAQSLAASFNSTPTMIDFLDNVAYQINITTTDSTGTFAVQASLDYQPGSANLPAITGNWVALTLSGSPSVAAANDNIAIALTQLPYRALRLSYTAGTAGTGVCDIYVSAKVI